MCSARLSAVAINGANKSVRGSEDKKKRGFYSKFTPEQQAAMNGNEAAVRHFKMGIDNLSTKLER